MNAAITTTFPVPKEQFPSWEFLRSFSKTNFFPQADDKQSYSFFWARNALYHSLKALGISRGANILLPAYICRAAVEPFEVYGSAVKFYGIARNCEPDLSEIEAKITTRTEAVLAVHYFGFPQRIRDFRHLCDRHGLALIEDCAHVLMGSADGLPLGRVGDASIFSWRKFLPIYDGGELWLNKPSGELLVPWSRETLPFTLKVAKSLLDRFFENSTSPAAKRISRGIESLRDYAKGLRKTASDKPLFELDNNNVTFDISLLNQKMSRVSRWIRTHSNIPAILSRRRQNYAFLQQRLQSVRGVTLLHRELPADVCPWVLPLFFEGIVDAHLVLQKYGVPAVNWAGVRSPMLSPGAFPDADFLYDALVFLPVHQNLRLKELEAIVDAVQKVSADAVAK
jgi:perosamine synthetase